MNAVLRAADSLGLPVDQVLRLDTLFAALAIVVFAFAVGILIGRLTGTRIERWADRRATKGLERIGARIRRLISAATASFLLLIAVAVTDLGFYGLLVLAVGLGLSTAILIYDLIRLMTVRAPIALVLALIGGVVALASTLGGLQPLLTALDGARLGIGAREISLLNLVNALLVVAILWVIVKFGVGVANRSISGAANLDLSQRVLFQKLATLAIIAVGFFVGIDLLGIDLTALAVFSGAFGLAVGFGMQKTLGNLISGLILLMDRSIKPGDVIVVGETFGWVNRIGMRAVSVLTRDGKEYLIPNENLMTETVENWSHTSRNVRLHVPVRVAYDCDIHLARELMLQAAREADRVLESPAPAVWIVGLGENGIDHDIRIWINDAEEGTGSVQSVVLTRILELFREHGITLPYPQRDVHVKSFPEPTLSERTKSS